MQLVLIHLGCNILDKVSTIFFIPWKTPFLSKEVLKPVGKVVAWHLLFLLILCIVSHFQLLEGVGWHSWLRYAITHAVTVLVERYLCVRVDRADVVLASKLFFFDEIEVNVEVLLYVILQVLLGLFLRFHFFITCLSMVRLRIEILFVE